MKIETLNALDANSLIKELNASTYKVAQAEAFLKLKAPSKKSESYRYFDTDCIVKNDYNIYEQKEPIFNKGKELIIQDGRVLGVPSSISVEVKEFADIDTEHFDPLYYLGHILAKDTIVVRVSSDCSFNIKHLVTENESLINYRVVILIDANVHASIYETFDNSSKDSFIMAGYDIFCAKDSSLNFITDRNHSSSCVVFSNRYKVDSNATFNLYTFDYANINTLTLFRTELHERANFDAKHLLYTKDSAKAGTVSQIVHRGESSNSNQTSKNILDNSSRGIFDALIKVEHSGKYTKAHQNSKAILISDGAYMASKPQLEIYIDDLEASHGSTTGQLDEAQLFYLQSRGITRDEAKKMLILGFANEIIDSIEDKEIQENVHISFESAYYGIPKLECLQSCNTCL